MSTSHGHGRHRSTSGGPVGGSAQGEFRPPSDTSADLYDVCNAFWSAGHGGRRDADGKESDWGKEGYETVLGRVKSASKGIEDMRALLKERCALLSHSLLSCAVERGGCRPSRGGEGPAGGGGESTGRAATASGTAHRARHRAAAPASARLCRRCLQQHSHLWRLSS